MSADASSGASLGTGVFLYRSENGSGAWTNKGVKLRWQCADDGVANTAPAKVCVYAIEMVYVPEGAFWLGSGGTEVGHFIEGYGDKEHQNTPFHVQSEDQIPVKNQPGCLWGVSTNGDSSIGQEGILPQAFPKGFQAFYCMKYEVSQGQYADFLNHLDSVQATKRCPGGSVDYRHTISGSHPNYSANAPTRACSYLRWADGAAYADWAGLRPMTELEYEKACRGPLTPVANEYAWGSATIVMAKNFKGIDGGGEETALPENANACYGGTYVRGPVRGGLFATASSGRQEAGASYWGIMEMSGNVWERTVTVGRPEGRAFTGAHGDGELAADGDADVSSWPGTRAAGSGYRGGSWYSPANYLRVSDRVFASSNYNIIRPWIFFDGWRAVHSAPKVNK